MDKALAIQKECNKCVKSLPFSYFSKHNQKRDGLHPTCKSCVILMRRAKVSQMQVLWARQNGSIMKTCKKCKENKPITRFHKQPTGVDGREGSCLDCRNYDISKSHLALMSTMSNEEQLMYKKRLRIERKYNMSQDELEDRIKHQRNSCSICNLIFSKDNRMYIDHDHLCCSKEKTCGQCTRGLLCKRCNWAIGLFDDNPEKLKSAVIYLERWNSGVLNISR